MKKAIVMLILFGLLSISTIGIAEILRGPYITYGRGTILNGSNSATVDLGNMYIGDIAKVSAVIYTQNPSRARMGFGYTINYAPAGGFTPTGATSITITTPNTVSSDVPFYFLLAKES